MGSRANSDAPVAPENGQPKSGLLLDAIQRRSRRGQRKVSAFLLRARGFTGQRARRWVRVTRGEMRRDYPNLTRRDKQRALAAGFRPATVLRFEIDEGNRDQFVSERDYHFVHPLNGKYAKWVRDRISTLKVFYPFADSFEPLHFQFLPRDGSLLIVPLSDAAKRYPPSLAGVADFLRDRGDHVLVPSAWNRSGEYRLGTGSRLGTEDTELFVDGNPHPIAEVEQALTALVQGHFYVLKEPGPKQKGGPQGGSVEPRTVRVLVINEDGTRPQVVEAQLHVRAAVTLRNLLRHAARVGTPTAAWSEKLRPAPSAELRESALEGVLEAFRAERAEAEARRARTGQPEEPADPVFDAEESRFDQMAEDGDALSVALTMSVDPRTGHFEGARTVVGQQLLELPFDPVTAEPAAGADIVPQWAEITRLALAMARFAPQLQFFQITFGVDGHQPKVLRVSALPSYSSVYPYREKAVEFLQRRVDEKHADHSPATRRQRLGKNTRLKIRRWFTQLFYPAGLVPYQSVRWLQDVRRDLFARNEVPLGKKLWAYRRGFLSYRLAQYGIDAGNWTEHISDFEYRWLRHINNQYKYWLEDKISIKYIAKDFAEFFPGYYFYTTAGKSGLVVVPLMDLPGDHPAGLEGILRLVRDRGALALKPEDGSHGEGFYRLEYQEGTYLLNGKPADENAIEAVLAVKNAKYLVTEFIQMHPELARVYPHSVNTVRMIVFKRDGVTPQIGNAYLRIGSSKSGFIDNTAAGGMLAEVDLETGRFHSGQTLDRGRVTNCPNHPATGEHIEGMLPHWDLVKDKVLEIAASLPQLEYLGFDVAITEEGFKLPEINRFPDYPRINKLTDKTVEYLLYKVGMKKKEKGYDHRPGRTLVSLPRRDKHNVA